MSNKKETPHYSKLAALLNNPKLPVSDKPRVEEAVERYHDWVAATNAAEGEPSEVLEKMVALFDEYKFFIDAELIFSSSEDFLYRQKGQLKLDNTVIEEFLPMLAVPKVIPELGASSFTVGSVTAYSSISFSSQIHSQPLGGGMIVKSKDQDFAIAKKLYLKSSHNKDFSEALTEETYLAYVAAECKTNLDKTMFQEASATAQDLKTAVVGAKYFLLAEWLDMTPLATTTTYIDEVLLLRKAKRISSNVRSSFSTRQGRERAQQEYKDYLRDNCFKVEVFARFCDHIAGLFPSTEGAVLEHGYF